MKKAFLVGLIATASVIGAGAMTTTAHAETLKTTPTVKSEAAIAPSTTLNAVDQTKDLDKVSNIKDSTKSVEQVKEDATKLPKNEDVTSNKSQDVVSTNSKDATPTKPEDVKTDSNTKDTTSVKTDVDKTTTVKDSHTKDTSKTQVTSESKEKVNPEEATKNADTAKLIQKDATTKAAAVTATDNNLTGALTRVYKGILNRNPGTDGLQAWSKSIDSNQTSMGQMITDTVYSKEFKHDNFAPTEFINNLFNGFLNRKPSQAELDALLKDLSNGTQYINVVNYVFNTPEFQSYLNSCKIKNIGAVSTSAGDKKASTEAFIKNVYKGILRREADPNGLNSWTSSVVNNNTSASQVLQGFITSNEFKHDNWSNNVYVQGIYTAIYGYLPAGSKVDYYTNLLNQGASKEYILNEILQTPESVNSIKSFGINNIGQVTVSLNNNVAGVHQLLNRIYHGVLNRKADTNGLNAWTDGIINHNASIGAVITDFMNSNEFKNDNFSNTEFVNNIFNGLLNRKPTEQELSYWESQFSNGVPCIKVAGSIFDSSEFQSYVKSIGITNIGTINTNVPLQHNVNGVHQLLNKIYHGILNRKADTNGLNAWTDGIINHNTSISSVINSFMNSGEFKNDKFSPTEFINNAFNGLLSRKPTEQELSYWKAQIASGDSYNMVVASIFNSSNFQNYLKEIGATNIGRVSNQTEQLHSIIRQFYRGLYNRAPGEGGLAWANGINNGSITIAKMFNDCLNSSEFKGQNFNTDQYLNSVILSLTGQAATKNQINSYLTQIMNGTSEQAILYEIFNSSAAQNRFKNAEFNSNIIGNINLTQAQKEGTKMARAKIINFNINLRQGPSVQTSILTNIPIGSNVVVIGRGQGPDYSFYKVQYVLNNKILTGYIATAIDGINTTQIYTDNKQNEFLGVLSAQYESNGDPGSISNTPGDPGGASYGAWQFSSNMGSLGEFVSWLQSHNTNFYNALTTAKKEDNGQYGTNFNNEWVNLAKNDYNTFFDLQHSFVQDRFYDLLVKNLMQSGNYINRLSSFAVRNVLWSTAVQNGPTGATQLIEHFNNVTNIKQFITDIYHQRGLTNAAGNLVYFPGCSQQIQQSLKNRFKNELNQALEMYNLEVQNNVL